MFDMQKSAFNSIDGDPQQAGQQAGMQMGMPGMGAQSSMPSGGGMSQPSSMAGSAPTNPAELRQLQKFAIAGVPGAKELFDIYKYKTDGVQLKPGEARLVNGQVQWNADPKTGFAGYGQNGEIRQSPNFNQLTADTAGATTGAQEAAKAALTPLPIGYVGTDSRPVGGSVLNYLRPGQPQGQSPQMGAQSGQQSGASMEMPDGFAPGSQFTDLSKLPQKVQAALAMKDPQAFAETMARNNGTMPAAQPQQAIRQSQAPMGYGSQPNGMQLQSAQEAQGIRDAQALDQASKLKDLDIQKNPLIEYKNKRAAAADATEKQIGLEAKTATDFTKRIQDMRSVLTFDANAGTPRRKQFAEMAQSLGAPMSMVNGIAGGNLADIQQFQKMAITNSMEALKSDMDSGRITQAEFQIYKENSPNISLLRDATEGIFNRAQERNALALRKQQEFSVYKSDAMKSNMVPDGFDAHFNQNLVTSGAVNPQVTQSAKAPPPKEAVNMLRMNPRLRSDFDAKYGPGASKSILGN